MKPVFKPFGCILCIAIVLSFAACDAGEADNVITISNGVVNTNNALPEKETLIENLENAGYTVSEYSSIDGSDLTIDRLIAEKEKKYIDITFGLSEEDSKTVFSAYCDMYKANNDYYILARNVDLVYCVTDKKTFSTAGFKSTSNIGEQYINN
ncbi:MAG: hypothetical protein J6K15_10910 [Lachnospiraceae bacterium]|nr:hypothetical protein [Lachnospiraceae bacterium]